MKRIFTILSAAALAMSLWANGTKVDGIYYLFSGTTATVTYSNSPSSGPSNSEDPYTGDVVIPATVTYESTTYNVTKIGEFAFVGCTGVTSIALPESLTTIEYAAFDGCSSLSEINLNNITSIDSYAFGGTAISSIVVPSGMTSIGVGVFQGMKYLTDVTIHDQVTSIGREAFMDCSRLQSIVIPNSVTSLGEGVFYGCEKLETITLSESLNAIPDKAFWCCYKLQFPVIPSSVTSIGNHAFYYCEAFTDITIPATVETIDKNAFCVCRGLKSVTIPAGVTSIGESAFAQCYSLEYIALPNTITKIQSYTFEKCYALKYVHIPNSVTSIGIAAFSECTSLKYVNIPRSVTEIKQTAFYKCSSLQEILLGAGVETIGKYVFEDCTALKNINIVGSHLINISDEAFYNWDDLKSVNVNVAADQFEAYQAHEVWGQCNVQVMNAGDVVILDEDDDIYVSPTDHSVRVAFRFYEQAETYELKVWEVGTLAEVCTVVFDKNGIVLGFRYAAPSRAPKATQEAGFVYTIEGLEASTEYAYEMKVKDAEENVVETLDGNFTTSEEGSEPTAIDAVEAGVQTKKLIRDGQLLIERDGKTYNAQGAKVR